MISLPLIAVANALTGPGDLVNALWASRGHVFVARSGREMSYQPGRRRDEVSLGNLARNRWDVRADFRAGAARAITVPWRAVFDDEAGIIDRPAWRQFPVGGWNRPGGRWATVAEILIAGGRLPEDANWCLGRRTVLARFDPANLEAALPALAQAVGGKYDPKTRRIEIDAPVFRAQALATVALRRADPRHEELPKAYADELLAFAMERLTDAQILHAYSRPGQNVEIEVGDVPLPVAVRHYYDDKLRVIGGGNASVASYIANSVDPKAKPRVSFNSAGSVGLLLMKKGGRSDIGF